MKKTKLEDSIEHTSKHHSTSYKHIYGDVSELQKSYTVSLICFNNT